MLNTEKECIIWGTFNNRNAPNNGTDLSFLIIFCLQKYPGVRLIFPNQKHDSKS